MHTFAYSFVDRNDYGQLALTNNHNTIVLPTVLPKPAVLDIYCGEFQTIITTDTQIRTRGLTYAKDFFDHDSSVHRLFVKHKLSNIKQSICGDKFVIVLTTTGSIYTWGNNTRGELGLGLHSLFKKTRVN